MNQSVKFLRHTVKEHYFLYNLHLRIKGRNAAAPSRYDDLFVTGYPRSGNSFFSLLLRCCFLEKKISSHYHAFCGVRHTLAHKVPTIVLVRNPMDAVTSLLIKRRSHERTCAAQLIEDYVRYHDKVLDKIEDKNLTIVKFEDAVRPSKVMVSEISDWLGWVKPEISLDVASEISRDRIENLVSHLPLTARSFSNESKIAAKNIAKEEVVSLPMFETAVEKYKEISHHPSKFDAYEGEF